VQWLVESEARADLGNVVRRRVVAGDHRRGIAGRETQQPEDDEGHHHHDGDGGRQPPEDEREHCGKILS
jgi:hypothetical protein